MYPLARYLPSTMDIAFTDLYPYTAVATFRMKVAVTWCSVLSFFTAKYRHIGRARECARYNPRAVACLFDGIPRMFKHNLMSSAARRPSVRQTVYRMASVLAAGVLLAGCAQAPYDASDRERGYVLSHDGARPIENATLNGFLDQTPGNSAVTASTSPWGNNVEVVAESRYFAASGRECRKLRIVTPSRETRKVLVCRTDNGWVEQRLVTQTAEGRP